jgi:23S rRNA (cytidine1920-2'-O)/16S rRNA (cytidine1409-2'-O)-methyltransferase
MSSRERIDRLLVERGFCDDLPRAQALVLAGKVVVNDHALSKPGEKVAVSADIRVKGKNLPFVSRGGLKLRAALDAFADLQVADKIAMDVGASTGGFSDCLLQAGVARVHAVDVGYGQLAWTIAKDPRVHVIDRQNIRDLAPDKVGERVQVVVADCSFISLTKVLPALFVHLDRSADVVALIKPHFEVSREKLEKGGILRDDEVRSEVLAEVLAHARSLGFTERGVIESPITGHDGNREYLAWWSWGKV